MTYRMGDGRQVIIRRAEKEEWETAMNLAFHVFLLFEADEYGKDGTDAFAHFVTDPMLKKLFLCNHYVVYVAVCDDTIIGVASLRNGNHLSLLFVHEDYHNNGVASALLRTVFNHVTEEGEYSNVTVHSSPYAVEFYHKMGFYDTGIQMEEDGILYTPMNKDV